MDLNNFENKNNQNSDIDNKNENDFEIDIIEENNENSDLGNSSADFSYDVKDKTEQTYDPDFEASSANVHVTDDVDKSNLDDTTNYKHPKHPVLKPVLISVLINIIVTALICSAFVAVYTIFGKIRLGKGFDDTMIVFRDGEDLRQKVDVNEALATLASDGEKPLTTQEIARKVGPAVVGIVSTGEASNGFFTQNYESSGSGILISADGYIVTNNHVVEGAKQVKVILNTNDEYEAKLIGSDTKTDLAVIKIEAEGLTWAAFGNSSGIEVGEPVVAIGNPLGMELAGTVTKGIVSATNRSIEVDGKVFTLIQTDTAINSGNSGGALVNCYGEVIGINSAKLAASGVEGLSFAIPADVAKPIIEDLIEVGYVQNRPSIGIIGHDITSEEAEAYELEIGVLVFNVVDNSAAKAAGIQRGDIIIECQGEKIKTVAELNAVRDKYKAGDEITLKIVRDDDTIDIKVVLGHEEQPKETKQPVQRFPY